MSQVHGSMVFEFPTERVANAIAEQVVALLMPVIDRAVNRAIADYLPLHQREPAPVNLDRSDTLPCGCPVADHAASSGCLLTAPLDPVVQP